MLTNKFTSGKKSANIVLEILLIKVKKSYFDEKIYLIAFFDRKNYNF